MCVITGAYSFQLIKITIICIIRVRLFSARYRFITIVILRHYDSSCSYTSVTHKLVERLQKYVLHCLYFGISFNFNERCLFFMLSLFALFWSELPCNQVSHKAKKRNVIKTYKVNQWKLCTLTQTSSN